jgi:mRNA-degrading endonuclease RelE of RelBE toxin-antitoxin system
MDYTIWILPHAHEQLNNLHEPAQNNVRQKIIALAKTPIPPDALSIPDTTGWRIYVLPYRIIYEVLDGQNIILILDIRV